LLLLRETVAVFLRITHTHTHTHTHTRRKYTLKNAELIYDSSGGTYNYHWA